MCWAMAVAKLKSADSSQASLSTRTCDANEYANENKRACCACNIGMNECEETWV